MSLVCFLCDVFGEIWTMEPKQLRMYVVLAVTSFTNSFYVVLSKWEVRPYLQIGRALV